MAKTHADVQLPVIHAEYQTVTVKAVEVKESKGGSDE